MTPGDSTGFAAAFMAGLLFGSSDALVRAASTGLNPRQNLFISLIIGTLLLWLLGLLRGGPFPSLNAIILFAVAGLLNFTLGRLLFYSVAYSGATTASIAPSSTSSLQAFWQ
jgi:drug/metabolite transporter (DMT)-like permease